MAGAHVPPEGDMVKIVFDFDVAELQYKLIMDPPKSSRKGKL